jgi:hypothetical protein
MMSRWRRDLKTKISMIRTNFILLKRMIIDKSMIKRERGLKHSKRI